ncbi:MAG: thioredoxin family protein [Tumebacillaceae bacterium]
MSNKTQKQIDKQIKREMAKKSNTRLVIILGSIMLILAVGLISYTMLGKSYDTVQAKTEEATANHDNLYKNEITIDQMKQKVASNDEFFAYFYQPDCVHCAVVSPFVFPLADSMHKTLLPVNIKGIQSIWDEYKVHGTPTIIHFKGGKEVGRIDGEHPEMEFSNFFNS